MRRENAVQRDEGTVTRTRASGLNAWRSGAPRAARQTDRHTSPVCRAAARPSGRASSRVLTIRCCTLSPFVTQQCSPYPVPKLGSRSRTRARSHSRGCFGSVAEPFVCCVCCLVSAWVAFLYLRTTTIYASAACLHFAQRRSSTTPQRSCSRARRSTSLCLRWAIDTVSLTAHLRAVEAETSCRHFTTLANSCN